MKGYEFLTTKMHKKMITSGLMSAIMIAGFGLTACASVIDGLPSLSIPKELYNIPLEGLRSNVFAVLLPGFGILSMFVGFRAIIALFNRFANH